MSKSKANARTKRPGTPAGAAILRPNSASLRITGPQLTGPSVFVLDDEPGILEIISQGLGQAGFRPAVFSSGRAFERAVALEPPEFCIVNLPVSDIDGIAILNELAQRDFRGRILLMSGLGLPVLRSVARLAEDYRLNIAGCLQKPFGMGALIEALNGAAPPVFTPDLAAVMEAIRGEQIVVRYQPIVDLVSREIVAVEALSRWQHPSEGLLPPSRFLDRLDQAGLIELTLYVLRKVFQNRAQWAREGTATPIAVNMPAQVAVNPYFTAELTKLTMRPHCGLDGIDFEIAERETMPDARLLAAALSSLCLKGARVTVDDFGAGFSSLSWLKLLPAGQVKIDKSFIRHCVSHRDDRKIVEAVIALAHALDLKAVAEGVESEETASLLSELGCDYAQGFLFGAASPASDIAGRLPREIITES